MNRKFWECAIERAIRTFCQTAIATIGTANMLGEVSWDVVLSAGILAGLLSILMSVVGGLPEVRENE